MLGKVDWASILNETIECMNRSVTVTSPLRLVIQRKGLNRRFDDLKSGWSKGRFVGGGSR